MSRFVKFTEFIILLVIVSCSNNQPKNMEDYRSWKTVEDTVFCYTAKIPTGIEKYYSGFAIYTSNTFYNELDSLSESFIWNIRRYPKDIYITSSDIQKNINYYDSVLLGKDQVLYVNNRTDRLFTEDIRTLKYDTDYFIFEIGTTVEEDSIFEYFYKSFTPDTSRLRLKHIEYINKDFDFPFEVDLEAIDPIIVGDTCRIKITKDYYDDFNYELLIVLENGKLRWNRVNDSLIIIPKDTGKVTFKVYIIDQFYLIWNLVNVTKMKVK